MFDYKPTLNILTTPFEMRGNLGVKEPLIQKKWFEQNIYSKILSKNKNNKPWVLHDGPPYANGNIHVGHALNKIIKDIIVRYANMQSFYSPFVLGWDTHGLPIEHALLKKSGDLFKNKSIVEFRKECKDFATQYINLQKSQFSRLGLCTDLNNFYATYDNLFEHRQLLVFLTMIKQKMIYQDLKPVYWSWSSQSALADAEVEYADSKSPSIYVTFDVISDGTFANNKLIIWTTTPWTIPANLAIAYHPQLVYCQIKYNNIMYIVAKQRIEAIANELGWKDYQLICEFNGDKLNGLKYAHCLYDKILPLIDATYVSANDGTGLVHNAPDFGEEDYIACKKHNIHPFDPLDKYCKFTSAINDQELNGVFYDDANKLITKRLENNHHLLKLSFISHTIAHDWRTKKPVVYRSTKQWFVNILKLQQDLLNALKNVSFFNNQNKTHIIDMIKNRYEWCISRQRTWGVPIPIIYHNDVALFDEELILNIINILKKETCDVWYEKPVEYFLTDKYKKLPGEFRKEKDIMDVWFDSGTSFLCLNANEFPADLYFEGNDQYRGWFNSSLINSVVAKKTAPYKSLLSHGFVLDEQGRKMSKSIGNVVDPLQICNVEGADVLRLWASNSNYQDDVRIGKSIISQTTEIYRRIRNTLFKFILSNISDFKYEKNCVKQFNDVSQHILSQLNNNIKQINNHFAKYEFSVIIKIINNHIIELSSWYFDLIKDVLYCDKPDSTERREAQTVLYLLLKTYLIFLTPIIPHTCEEVYSFFNCENKKESVMLEDWQNDDVTEITNISEDKWNYFYKLKEVVFAQLEIIRQQKQINKNSQAQIELSFDNAYSFNEQQLKKYFNVAKVIFKDQHSKQISCQASNANMARCERCWNYYEQTQLNKDNICERCSDALKK